MGFRKGVPAETRSQTVFMQCTGVLYITSEEGLHTDLSTNCNSGAQVSGCLTEGGWLCFKQVIEKSYFSLLLREEYVKIKNL